LKKVTTAGFLILTILVGGFAHASRHKPVKKSKRQTAIHAERASKEQQLAKLKQEIAKYESELREHEKKEKRSKENIAAFEKRTKQLKAAIAHLEQEVSDLESQKSEVDKQVQQTSNSLDNLKLAYARSSAMLYREGALKSSDPNEAFFVERSSDPIRMSYYAQVVAQAHGANRAKLDSAKQTLSDSSQQLASSIENEHQTIGEHQQQASTLEQKRIAEAKQLAQIQANKERLRKLLKQRMESEKKLEGIIDNLVIKEENARRTTKSGRRTNNREPENEPSLGPAHGPHSLSWPSAGHRIVQGFGEHRNAELNTVTMNLGIDIAAAQGSSVNAAAEGEVDLVSSLPSYGTIVVLRHAGGLHTVYADLAGASVSKGAHVRAGQQIGTSGTNEENGAVLHFEVWKGKSKQNPLGWLR
jgi:septal ring factor EnvC (AmiA/AmiB activator)